MYFSNFINLIFTIIVHFHTCFFLLEFLISLFKFCKLLLMNLCQLQNSVTTSVALIESSWWLKIVIWSLSLSRTICCFFIKYHQYILSNLHVSVCLSFMLLSSTLHFFAIVVEVDIAFLFTHRHIQRKWVLKNSEVKEI